MDRIQLQMGIREELEHARHFPISLRKYYAEEIAKDHLKENPKYYSVLKKAMRKVRR